MDIVNLVVSPQRVHRTPATSRTSFGVVICAHTVDRWSDLLRAVSSIEHQTLEARIVIVIDHEPALFGRAHLAFDGRADVVMNTGPKGLSGARNTGQEHLDTDVVAFIDDDAEAEPTWLEQLSAVFRDPLVLAVGGKVAPMWPDGRRPHWLPEEFEWVLGCSYRGLPQRRSTVRNLIGCNMAFRRSVLRSVGSFHSELGRIGGDAGGCEETEMCVRATQLYPHGRIVYEPRAVVRHHLDPRRLTFSYFVRRCRGEGRSKARVTRLVGSSQGLASERRYVAVTLPTGFVRHIANGSPQRSAVLVAGFLTVTSCYVRERIVQRATGRDRA
jgi:GT2 family glycosyltransferase